jgi:hypothetical protein
MDEFRDVLSFCDLHDLGFSGLPYAWDNGRSGGANVQVKLDRAVADPAWRYLFTNAKVHHLLSSLSDHCPVLVELWKDVWDKRGSRIFRYEVMWERVESLSAEIKRLWCSTFDKNNLCSVV